LPLKSIPSPQNWQPYNWLKPPGVLRAQTLQAVAQGADGTSYFQWRRSQAGIEKLHGAVVEHHGRSDARVFTEVAGIGRDLAALSTNTLDGRVDAKVAVRLFVKQGQARVPAFVDNPHTRARLAPPAEGSCAMRTRRTGQQGEHRWRPCRFPIRRNTGTYYQWEAMHDDPSKRRRCGDICWSLGRFPRS